MTALVIARHWLAKPQIITICLLKEKVWDACMEGHTWHFACFFSCTLSAWLFTKFFLGTWHCVGNIFNLFSQCGELKKMQRRYKQYGYIKMHNSGLLDIKDPGTADKPNQSQFQIILPKENAFQERFRNLACPRHRDHRAQASGPGKTEHPLPFSSDTSLRFPDAPSSVRQVTVLQAEWKYSHSWC